MEGGTLTCAHAHKHTRSQTHVYTHAHRTKLMDRDTLAKSLLPCLFSVFGSLPRKHTHIYILFKKWKPTIFTDNKHISFPVKPRFRQYSCRWDVFISNGALSTLTPPQSWSSVLSPLGGAESNSYIFTLDLSGGKGLALLPCQHTVCLMNVPMICWQAACVGPENELCHVKSTLVYLKFVLLTPLFAERWSVKCKQQPCWMALEGPLVAEMNERSPTEVTKLFTFLQLQSERDPNPPAHTNILEPVKTHTLCLSETP